MSGNGDTSFDSDLRNILDSSSGVSTAPDAGRSASGPGSPRQTAPGKPARVQPHIPRWMEVTVRIAAGLLAAGLALYFGFRTSRL